MSQWGSQKHWTPDSVLQAIRTFATEIGWYPETLDFARQTPRLPSRATVLRLFGSLAEARRQAGMDGGGFAGHGGPGRGGGWTKGKTRRGPPTATRRVALNARNDGAQGTGARTLGPRAGERRDPASKMPQEYVPGVRGTGDV